MKILDATTAVEKEWKSSRRVNGILFHIACKNVNIVFTQRFALICYTFTRDSSCAFHNIFIPSLVPRHISRLAQYTQHFDLIFNVDHVRNTLRRFTSDEKSRCQKLQWTKSGKFETIQA